MKFPATALILAGLTLGLPAQGQADPLGPDKPAGVTDAAPVRPTPAPAAPTAEPVPPRTERQPMAYAELNARLEAAAAALQRLNETLLEHPPGGDWPHQRQQAGDVPEGSATDAATEPAAEPTTAVSADTQPTVSPAPQAVQPRRDTPATRPASQVLPTPDRPTVTRYSGPGPAADSDARWAPDGEPLEARPQQRPPMSDEAAAELAVLQRILEGSATQADLAPRDAAAQPAGPDPSRIISSSPRPPVRTADAGERR
jgi:hypothetical protein